MRKHEVLAILAEHREELAATYKVKSLAIFGSVARDDAGPNSDVDLLVEFNGPVGLLDLVGLQQRFEGLLGRPVDLATREGLKRQLRDKIINRPEEPGRYVGLPIEDIVEHCERVQRFVQRMDFERFRSHELTRDAVAGCLTAIAHAATRLPPGVEERHPEIPWATMREMEKLISEYYSVDLAKVWRVATEDFPGALPALRRVLEELKE